LGLGSRSLAAERLDEEAFVWSIYCFSLKNKFPAGGVMVRLFVPLRVAQLMLVAHGWERSTDACEGLLPRVLATSHELRHDKNYRLRHQLVSSTPPISIFASKIIFNFSFCQKIHIYGHFIHCPKKHSLRTFYVKTCQF
jgi:hypothetical protein